MALVDHLAGDAEPGDERGGATGDDVGDLGLEAARQGGEQVDAERLGGRPPHGGDLVAHLVVGHGRGPEAAEAAGLAHRRCEPVVGDAAHAGEHHGVLDLEGVGEPGGQHATMLVALDRAVKSGRISRGGTRLHR